MAVRLDARRIQRDVLGIEASPSPIRIPRGDEYGGGGKYGAIINDEDRTFAILREPVAFRVVHVVAADVFDNWFKLELEEGKEEENKVFDSAIQKKLRQLKAKQMFTRMATFERGYGYSIIVLGYEDEADSLQEPLKNPTSLEQIRTFGKRQISRILTVKDRDDPRYGFPLIYNIVQQGTTKRLKVHYSRVIHVATRYIDLTKAEWEGQSVLDALWDDIVVLRNIRWSMGQTMYRYGSGFPVFTFKGAERDKIQAWVDAGLFGDISTRSFFVGNEKQTIDFKGLAGRALNPEPYYLAPMEHVSCASGIPLAILRGVQAGALTGSEVNQSEYWNMISDEQTAYEPALRKLIDIIRLLEIGKQKEPKLSTEKIGEAVVAIATDAQEFPAEADLPGFLFNWKGGFELDEQKLASIELTKAQTLQIKGGWHTRNELRKMENPDAEDLPEGQGGDEILGFTKPLNLPPGSQKFQVKEHADGTLEVAEVPRRDTRS